MKMKLSRITLIAAVLCGWAVAPVTAQLVQGSATRQASVTAAQQMLATKEITPLADGLNPFFSVPFLDAMGMGQKLPTPPVHTDGPRTDRDILAGIAATMKPTGYFVLGGQPTLVFGQKRVKAGGEMTINFEGGEYTVGITAIDRTSFTLRLNREEYTRPIK
jgi:hypothetical protein